MPFLLCSNSTEFTVLLVLLLRPWCSVWQCAVLRQW